MLQHFCLTRMNKQTYLYNSLFLSFSLFSTPLPLVFVSFFDCGDIYCSLTPEETREVIRSDKAVTSTFKKSVAHLVETFKSAPAHLRDILLVLHHPSPPLAPSPTNTPSSSSLFLVESDYFRHMHIEDYIEDLVGQTVGDKNTYTFLKKCFATTGPSKT